MRVKYEGEPVQVVNTMIYKGRHLVCVMFSDSMTEWVPFSSISKA